MEKNLDFYGMVCHILLMARPLLIAHRQNATIEELKQVSRVGSSETATRCSAIQMLLAGADRDLVCKALLVTNRALRKWMKPIKAFHFKEQLIS